MFGLSVCYRYVSTRLATHTYTIIVHVFVLQTGFNADDHQLVLRY